MSFPQKVKSTLFSASAFIQQRAKLLPETFRHILRQFNLHFPTKGLMGRYSLIAADDCEFNIARNHQDPSHLLSHKRQVKKGLQLPPCRFAL